MSKSQVLRQGTVKTRGHWRNEFSTDGTESFIAWRFNAPDAAYRRADFQTLPEALVWLRNNPFDEADHDARTWNWRTRTVSELMNRDGWRYDGPINCRYGQRMPLSSGCRVVRFVCVGDGICVPPHVFEMLRKCARIDLERAGIIKQSDWAVGDLIADRMRGKISARSITWTPA